MTAERSAIVTGSTSGIGLAIAEALARSGHDVMLNGLGKPEDVETVRAEMADKYGVEVRFSGADMSRPDAIAEMIATAEQAFGKVDILVNNAGIQYVALIEEFPPEKWDQILSINLSASFHAISHVLPGMKQRKFGRIVQIASAHALVASPFKSAYVAAKHGIAGFTKTVALEVATKGITVNAIAPGYVWTPLVEKQIPDTMKARNMTKEQVINDVLLLAQPTKEFVTVEQVAALAVFLCTDSAKSITGTTLPMDGGWTAA